MVLFFALAILGNIALGLSVKGDISRWLNVPPPPSGEGALISALGDRQLGYVSWGLALQNLGDMRGQATALREYNYAHIKQWFFMLDRFDPNGRFAPYLAAYYFSGTDNKESLGDLVDYLEVAGQREGADNWRWLVQAIYIARFKMNNLDRALSLAHTLANLPAEGRPAWTYQMPAFIYNAKGDKAEARAIVIEMLKSSAQSMAPEEIYSARLFLCDRLYTAQEREVEALCKNI